MAGCPSSRSGTATPARSLPSGARRPSTGPGATPATATSTGSRSRSAPGKVRYIVNGHLFFEDDDPSPTSPWLALFTHRERHTAWRNLAIRGEPTIPRVVRLSQADRLEGWVSGFYNESQPPRRTVESTDQYGNVSQVAKRSARPGSPPSSGAATIDPDAFDWCSIDGVIRGRRTLETSRARLPTVRGWRGLRHRPEPALLSSPAPRRRRPRLRVPLRARPGHGPSDARPAGLPAGARRGPAPLDDLGVARPLGPAGRQRRRRAGESPRPGPAPAQAGRVERNQGGAERRSGSRSTSTAWRSTSASWSRRTAASSGCSTTSSGPRCRSGTWSCAADGPRPSRPPSGPTWRRCEPSEPNTEADRRARHAVIGEPFFSLQADEVLARAPSHEARGSLSPPVRTGSCRAPIIPTSGSAAISRPATPPRRSASESERDGTPTAASRRRCASRPAARSARRPSSWSTRPRPWAGPGSTSWPTGSARPRPTTTPTSAAGWRMLALIAMARGEDDKAVASLEQLKPLLEKRPADQPEGARWPELTVAARAIERPRLRPAALALLEILVDQAQKKSPRWLWEHHVKNMLRTGQAARPARPRRPSLRHRPRGRPLGAGHARAGRHPRRRRPDPAMDLSRRAVHPSSGPRQRHDVSPRAAPGRVPARLRADHVQLAGDADLLRRDDDRPQVGPQDTSSAGTSTANGPRSR